MKKILVFLAAFCAIGCSGNVNSPQSEDPSVTTTSMHDMTNDQLRNKIVMALDDMKAKAVEMGIQGVATASVLNKSETDDWIGEMKVVGTPCNEKEGWNLVAIAWSKCGEVIATGADSGNPDHKKIMGELGFVGGAYDEFDGCKMAFAFSGATSEDDLIVAKYGIKKMKEYLSDKPKEVSPAGFKPLATPLKKEQFIQVNIIVDDIRRSAKAWAALLGVPEPEIWVNHLQTNGEYPYTYRGKDVPCDLQMCVIDMGSWVLELHQVDNTPSTFREFQDKHGFGVHHLGFEVGDDRDEVIRELKAMGFDTERTIGVYPGSSWTIVDSEDVLGVNLNIKPKR
ncbi:MAG: VOC family protein [Bacteroidales bacterium]|nr:VOC family protein [Bacteroidales bacterium]